MKRVQLFATGLTLLLSIFFITTGIAQTDDYSCNVIYGDDVNHPLEGVQVDLYDNNDDYIETKFTGEDGFFTFEDLTIGESYIAKFSYDDEVDFVDLEDAFTLLGYLWGWVDLSDLQLLAADVDASSQIDYYDFWYIIYYYVFEIPFPAGAWVLPDWEFEMTADKLMGGPSGVSNTGDLPTGGLGKGNHSIQLDYNELVTFNNTELIIPINFSEAINTNGFGLVLGYNSELIEVTKIESQIDSLKYNIKDGIIKIGWTDILNSYKFSQNEPIVKIHIKQNLNLSNGQIESFELLEGTHILDKSGKKYSFISFTSSEFKLSDAQTTLSAINETAYPNPCTGSFTIETETSENALAHIQIYNNLGQLVKSEFVQVSNQKLIINTQDINAGIYIYHINIQSKLISGSISIQN